MDKQKPFDPSALMTARADRLQSKLDVLVMFLHERLRLRKESIDSLDTDERNIRSLLSAFEERRKDGRIEASGLEASLVGHELSVQRERRSQETACWNDLLRLMQQMLQVWEASEEAKSKQSLLHGNRGYGMKPDQDYSRISRKHG
jgi:hypothetical protein